MAKRLSEFFRGYDKAFGVFEVGSTRNGQKVEGKAYTVSQPITETEWENHIKGGRQGIGIIPLLEDNTLYWGCIDVDKYDIQIPNLSMRISSLPLTLFRSKSGGAHLICFVKEPVPAASMVKYLRKLVKQLGFAKATEVFPKQITREVDANGNVDIGNWLNMPYYGGDRSTRYAVVNGRALSLDECIAHIEAVALTADQFFEISGLLPDVGDDDDPFSEQLEAESAEPTPEEQELKILAQDEEPPPAPEPPPRPRLVSSTPKKTETSDDSDNVETIQFADGPPCLQTLAKRGGFPEGSRNNGIFNVAVYLRKKYPSDWQSHLESYNSTMCKPPLKRSEMSHTVSRSAEKKDYSFLCDRDPIAPLCQIEVCRARRYGVGVTESKVSEFTLVKHEGDPVIWDVIFEGLQEPMALTTEELYSQTAFGKKTMEFKDRVPPTMPENRWRQFLDRKVIAARRIPAEQDETNKYGMFKVVLENFCIMRPQGMSMDDVQNGHVYTDGEGMTWFRGVWLMEYIRARGAGGLQNARTDQVWSWLQRRGAIRETKLINKSPVIVWGIAQFKRDDNDIKLPDSLNDFKDGGKEPF